MEYHEGSITLDTDKMVENELLKYKMYGFPKCCTTAMINNQGINLVLDKKINKTKLKPCVDCAIEIIEGRKTLSYLITDTRLSILEPFKEKWEKHGSFVNTKKEEIYEKQKKRRNSKGSFK